jgi:hypothetical protein
MAEVVGRSLAALLAAGLAAHAASTLAAEPLAGGSPLLATPQTPQFRDRTRAAGLADAVHALPESVVPDDPGGIGVSTFDALKVMIGGGAVGDFDNDGWQDLFFLSGGVEADRLYINNRDGTFSDRAAAWGVARVHVGAGAAVADYDGDGWLDVYVTSWGQQESDGQVHVGPGRNILYRNTGRGSFEDVASDAGVQTAGEVHADTMGAAFGDFDLDGDLDLFIAGYLQISLDDNFSNKLFRNDGGTFTDVSNTHNGFGNFFLGFAPRFVDMDGDLHPELLITGDFGGVGGFGLGSKYLQNVASEEIPGINFVNVTQASGTGLDDNGMGSTIADFDGDGRLDWYVTSIFKDGDPTQTGNKLYVADGVAGIPPFDHVHYREAAFDAGVDDGGWGWGTVAIDANHDGLVDLVETNGWQNDPDHVGERMFLFRNEGVHAELPRFANVPASQSGLDHDGQGRGLLNFDYDNDGDQDLVVFGNQEPLRLYRNDLRGLRTGWIRIFLDASGDPAVAPNGVGALVWVSVDGASQQRPIEASSSYLSQSELSAHFGLGATQTVDEIRVEWPGGRVTHLFDVPSNRTLTVAVSHGDVNGDGCVDVVDLLRVLAAWGPCRECPEDLNFDGRVGSDDLDTVLANWATCG